MSLSFENVEPVLVADPRVIVENKRDYAILKSGSQTTWKQWTSTSISTTSINFSCPPPSGGIFVDRKIYFILPVQLTFTGIPPVGVTLLNVNRDAPRAFPISGSIQTIQMSINNQSMSFDCADVIHALLRFNNNVQLKNGDYSLTPNMYDQSQQYNDLYGTIRSPLFNYGDSQDGTELNRGGFPFQIISNPVGDGVATMTAIVQATFCEPLFISPLFFGKDNGSAFFNVNSMDFTFNFVSGTNSLASRMWSHDDQLGANVITSANASFINVINAQPLLLIQYITPMETQVLSPNMPICYPYFDVQRYVTDLGSVPAAPALGSSQTVYSNNIQMSSIPRRIYIYIRQRNQDLYNNPSNTDTYAVINSLSIQFLNKTGLLSGATQQSIYMMSQKNHCNLSWTQWSGGPVQKPGTWASTIGTVGSVVCIELATDIGLDSLTAPGKLEQSMLQVQVNFTNIANRTLNMSLYVVPVLEGLFEIQGLGRAVVNIGVISSKDILDCQSKPGVDYNDVQHVNGGNFFSALKNFGSKIGDFLKRTKIISRVLGSPIGRAIDVVTKLPISHALRGVAEHYGYGEGEGEGEGILVGGRRIKRNKLKHRLM